MRNSTTQLTPQQHAFAATASQKLGIFNFLEQGKKVEKFEDTFEQYGGSEFILAVIKLGLEKDTDLAPLKTRMAIFTFLEQRKTVEQCVYPFLAEGGKDFVLNVLRNALLN